MGRVFDDDALMLVRNAPACVLLSQKYACFRLLLILVLLTHNWACPEEWNELHHSQIMEALGGDQLWIDRFAAQHAAIIYYWCVYEHHAFTTMLVQQGLARKIPS